MTNPRSLRLASLLLVAAACLSGCAGMSVLDANVQSYSTLAAVPSPPTYRFERLPSQLNDPAQARLEALVDASLARAGLRRDDAAPALSVQVWTRWQQVLSPWALPPRWNGWTGWGSVGMGAYRGVGVGVGVGFPLGMSEPPWYQREVGLILREVASGRVVYETHASSEGRRLDAERAWPAMMDAALQGFPRPPQGLRRVEITMPR